jgi:DMSO/TMAO reductase YedYZ molybdopterin-dependent catalytic subunit
MNVKTLFEAARRGAGMPGLFAAAAVIIAQRLLHGALHEAPFAPTAAAEWVIRKSPGPVATYVIDNLGHNGQTVLTYTCIAAALVLGYAVGRRPAWVLAAAAFVLTLLAAYLDPLARDVAGAIGSASVAALVAFLAQTALRARPEAKAAEGAEAGETVGGVDWGRRQFLSRVGLGAVFVAVAATAGLRSGSRSTPKGSVHADQPAVVPIDSGFREVAGLSPRTTPRDDHYTVDIDVEDPLIDESSWRLVVDGAVTTPLSLSLADLQAMGTEERLNNLSCISNPVGGDLIGNSRWTGVPLDALLDMAQPRPEAVTLVAASDDGFTDGIRLDEIRGKDAWIAFGMNGELLPRSHGFPARLLFPNHYGMRNVKWLTRLELKTEDEQGYWARRGWDRDAVVRTESRFDVPNGGATVQSPFTCAGIAWAGSRRIQAVEVSADGGETWQAAQLETELAPLSWRRWQISLDLPPGRYTLAVRATDGTGTPQDVRERDPHPSGASGYHRIDVTVA